MTSQTKHYIELSDIVAIRFECKNCHTAILVPMQQAFEFRKLIDCPGCSRGFIAPSGDISIQREIADFISSWGALKKVFPPEGKFVSELSLTLEVKGVVSDLASADHGA